MPNLPEWLARERLADASVALSAEDRAALAVLDREESGRRPEPAVDGRNWYHLHMKAASER
jgi:hypothetical protein